MSKRSSGRGARFSGSRRQVIKGMAAGGALAITGCGDGDLPQPGAPTSGGDPLSGGSLPPLPKPEDSGIDHIVVVMMENRSYDHYLGWVPGGDGRQDGLQFPDKNGDLQSTFRLSQDPAYGYQGCGKADPDHSYAGGRVEYNNGGMDAWLLTDGTEIGDRFPIGYYTAEDLPFNAGVAANWTVCDRYFCSILSQTFPNRFYMHCGQTDRNDNGFALSSMPTIWDRMQAAGRSVNFYFSDLPFIGLLGPQYGTISKEFVQFQLDAALGNLPNLCFVDPSFGALLGEVGGFSSDDHPRADVRAGQSFLNQVYEALRTSPQWENTLLIVNYDEWGGFYDHVVPPLAPVSPLELAATGNDGRLGFRVPGYLIGPRARKAHVSHLQFDHCSVLNFIAWRFGLEPLGVRGQSSLNIAHALDFSSPLRTDTPKFNVPFVPAGLPCAGIPKAGDPYAKHQSEWDGLYQIVKSLGYPVR